MRRSFRIALIVLAALSGLAVAGAQAGDPLDDPDLLAGLVAADPGLTYAVEQAWLTALSTFDCAPGTDPVGPICANTFTHNDRVFAARFGYVDELRSVIWFSYPDALTTGIPGFTLHSETDPGESYPIRAIVTRRAWDMVYGYVEFDRQYSLWPSDGSFSPLLLTVEPEPGTDASYELQLSIEPQRSTGIVSSYQTALDFGDVVSGTGLRDGEPIAYEVWWEAMRMAPSMTQVRLCIGWNHPAILYAYGFMELDGRVLPFTRQPARDADGLEGPTTTDDLGRTADCYHVEAPLPATYRRSGTLVITHFITAAGEYLYLPTRIAFPLTFV